MEYINFHSWLFIFIAVPCISASLDCPSHSRCLTQSSTGQSICLQSCYRDNGGCAADDVCVTELLVDDCQYGEECETDVTCRSLNGIHSSAELVCIYIIYCSS